MILSGNVHEMRANWPKHFWSICITQKFVKQVLLLKKLLLKPSPKRIQWIIFSRNTYFTIKRLLVSLWSQFVCGIRDKILKIYQKPNISYQQDGWHQYHTEKLNPNKTELLWLVQYQECSLLAYGLFGIITSFNIMRCHLLFQPSCNSTSCRSFVM